MKISDPLGKVYTHTMFKKNSKGYDVKESSPGKYSKHNKSRDVSEDDVDVDEEEEDGDEISGEEVSDQSDDSLSTKSSRVERVNNSNKHNMSTTNRNFSVVRIT